jgi:biopolymer transport protein ExbD
MQKVNRLILISVLSTSMTGGLWAAEDGGATNPAAEYKRADTQFYPQADVVKVHPTAIIIPVGGYSVQGDSYFFTPKKKAPKNMYVEVLNDWIEPITPPDMPASLGVPPDAMQIREPQGDVETALPSAPANFVPVTDGMTLPNGAVVKTGANGTAAVLFGGVDSARLMPNSEAAVQQTVTAQSRSAEVDLTAGGVFSKVGTQIGVQGDYEVRTPFGNASAHGGDFVTIISGSRTDVWIAQGTVEFGQTETKKARIVISDGTGPLKILRDPIADPHLSLLADAETLTAILNFIPMANQKIKALRDKMASGGTLTANEQIYLNRIKQVPSLIKLALVTPPAPTPPPATASAPGNETPAPHLALGGPLPYTGPPEAIDLRSDGKVDLNGETITLDGLKSRLAVAAQLVPNQPVVITGRENVTHDQLKKVIAICHAAKLKVHVAKAAKASSAPVPPPVVPAPTPVIAPPVPTPTPAPAVAPTAIQPAATNLAIEPAAAPAPPAPSPAIPKPLRAVVRVDGKINFQGATYELPEFKLKLEALMKTTPDQAIVLRVGKKVSYEDFQAALQICHSIPVNHLTIAGTPPTPQSAFSPATEPAAEPAANLPAPGLLMHPSMEPMSSNAPPETPSAPPTTNAPPPAGP